MATRVTRSRSRSSSVDSLSALAPPPPARKKKTPSKAPLKAVEEDEEEEEYEEEDEHEVVVALDDVNDALDKTDNMESTEAFIRQIDGLNDKVTEFSAKVSALREFFVKIKVLEGDDIVDYLTTKQQMLLSYCANLVFYISMKIEGKSVEDHPVMKQMLKLRLCLEKMRPIDGKLKYQIDRLIQQSTNVSEEGEEGDQSAGNKNKGIQPTSRPNPLALLAKDGSDENDEDSDEDSEDSEDGGKNKKKSNKWRGKVDKGEEETDIDPNTQRSTPGSFNPKAGIYRAPRMEATPYLENESAAQKQEDKLKRQRKKLKNSEMFEALREEFSTAPETSGSGGVSELSNTDRKLAQEATERKDYEEDRFIRMTLTRKDKKDKARRENGILRLDKDVGNMGDVGDLDDLVNMYDEQNEQQRRDQAQLKKRSRAGGSDAFELGDNEGSSKKKGNKGNKRSSSSSMGGGDYEDSSPAKSKGDAKMQRLSDFTGSSAAIERAAAAFSKSAAKNTDLGVMKGTGSGKKSKKGKN